MEAETLADVVWRIWVKRHGCPMELHSNQGRQFESKLFQSLCKALEIDERRTTPGNPRSYGFVKKTYRTVKKHS